MKGSDTEVIIKNAECNLRSHSHGAQFSIQQFHLHAGEQLSLVGKSGSGKSSLLNLVAGFLPVHAGSLSVCGKELKGMSEGERDIMRREGLGMVFQTYQLLDEFSVLENVLMGSYFSELKMEEEDAAYQLLKRVGLTDFMKRLPTELSVGQRQRVSIARALIKKPQIILADEPTGALDKETGTGVCDLLQELSEENGSSIIFVTHDEALASRFQKQVHVSDLIEWKKP